MRAQILVSPDLLYCLSSPLESINEKEFLMETEILKKLRHRHLITLFAVCTSSAPFYIITELMEKGNLLSFLRGLLPFFFTSFSQLSKSKKKVHQLSIYTVLYYKVSFTQKFCHHRVLCYCRTQMKIF